MRDKVFSTVFLLLLLAGAAAHFLIPDRYYSEHEKRTLKQFPALSWEAIRSGKFGADLEDYLADQFPGRDGWVAAKTMADRLSGKRESGGVYFADGGYLIEAHKSFSESQISVNLEAIKELQTVLDSRNIPIRIMFVPTASAILSDLLPPCAPNADQGAVIAAAEQLGLDVVDVSDVLTRHKEEYLFYKTDHHWTSLGAYYAYAAWMEARGAAPDPIDAWTKETLCTNFRGTTYTKCNDPLAPCDTIDAYYKTICHPVDYDSGYRTADTLYERKYLDGTDQYAVFLDSNHATTVISGKGSGRCLILKDSYANCFAQFCADDFEETHLIDIRFFTGSVQQYIEENGITEVLVLYNIPNFAEDTAIARCAR